LGADDRRIEMRGLDDPGCRRGDIDDDDLVVSAQRTCQRVGEQARFDSDKESLRRF
jgi:hypothetical protein